MAFTVFSIRLSSTVFDPLLIKNVYSSWKKPINTDGKGYRDFLSYPTIFKKFSSFKHYKIQVDGSIFEKSYNSKNIEYLSTNPDKVVRLKHLLSFENEMSLSIRNDNIQSFRQRTSHKSYNKLIFYPIPEKVTMYFSFQNIDKSLKRYLRGLFSRHEHCISVVMDKYEYPNHKGRCMVANFYREVCN